MKPVVVGQLEPNADRSRDEPPEVGAVMEVKAGAGGGFRGPSCSWPVTPGTGRGVECEGEG